MIRRIITASLILILSAPSFAEFPDRPIQIIVPYSAGGSTDLSTRLLAETLQRVLPGASIDVVNMPGNGAALGVSTVLNAPADGYTLGAGAQGPLSIKPHIGGTGYSLDDITFIGMMSRSLQLMVACKGAPFENFDEFMEYANNAYPKIGNSGAGGANHVSVEAFAKNAGILVSSVHFPGSSKAREACIRGEIDAMVASPAEALKQSKRGNMTPLFLMEKRRIYLFPDTPTTLEKGINFTWSSWKGLIAPKGIPELTLKKLRDAFAKAVADKEFQTKMTKMGAFLEFADAEKLELKVRSDSAVAESVLRSLNMYGKDN